MTSHGIDRTNEPLKFVVLAGSFREYRNWLDDHHLSRTETIYVSNSQVLRGKSFELPTTFVIVGTFHARRDSREILDMVRSRFSKDIKHDYQ